MEGFLGVAMFKHHFKVKRSVLSGSCLESKGGQMVMEAVSSLRKMRGQQLRVGGGGAAFQRIPRWNHPLMVTSYM